MELGNAVVRYTSKYRALGDKEGEYVTWNGLNSILIGLIAGVIGFTL